MGSKRKRDQASSAVGAKKAAKAEDLNPFEHIRNRRKHDVIGRKVKGEHKQLGRARKLAYENREKALLPQLQRMGKKGKFKDERVGEGVANLSEEQKAALRFQLERKMRSKKQDKYNLEEGELTHMGKSLSADMDFSDVEEQSDEDPDRGEIDERIVEQAHFGGGGDNQEQANLTRKEIYDQIISKSKTARHERQQQKAGQEEARRELDEKYPELLGLMAHNARPKGEKAPLDEYDKLTRELAYDRTARPSHKELTTEEQLAREKQRLEMLERERQHRMREDVLEEGGANGERAAKRARVGGDAHTSGDALDENYELHDFAVGGGGEREESDGDEEGDDSEGEEEGEGEGEEEDEEEEGEEDEGEDGEEGDSEEGDEGNAHQLELLAPASDSESDEGQQGAMFEDDGEEGGIGGGESDQDGDAPGSDAEVEGEGDVSRVPPQQQPPQLKVPAPQDQEDASIPFTFALPKSIDEFWELLDSHEGEKKFIVLQRMYSCNHVKADTDLEGDMQRFLDVLVAAFMEEAGKQPIVWGRADLLVFAIFHASQQVPEHAHKVLGDRLVQLRKAAVRDVHRGNAFKWPSIPYFCFFRLLGHVFPVTDIRHKCITPMLTHMAQCLTHSPLDTPRDAFKALFLCNLFLQFTYQAKRFVPEVFHCLFRLLPTANNPNTLLSVRDPGALKSAFVGPVPFGLLYNHQHNVKYLESDAFRLNGLVMAYRILIGHLNFLSSHAAADGLYATVQAHLRHTAPLVPHLPKEAARVRESLQEKLASMRAAHAQSRFVLQLQRRKPQPIKQFDPVFREGVDFDRKHATPESAKAQKQKLERQLKRETKGAIRELRKDALFLAQQSEKRRAESDARREAKDKAAMAFLEHQEATFKQQAKSYRNLKQKANKKRR